MRPLAASSPQEPSLSAPDLMTSNVKQACWRRTRQRQLRTHLHMFKLNLKMTRMKLWVLRSTLTLKATDTTRVSVDDNVGHRGTRPCAVLRHHGAGPTLRCARAACRGGNGVVWCLIVPVSTREYPCVPVSRPWLLRGCTRGSVSTRSTPAAEDALHSTVLRASSTGTRGALMGTRVRPPSAGPSAAGRLRA